jgi:hypothetical protein
MLAPWQKGRAGDGAAFFWVNPEVMIITHNMALIFIRFLFR